MNIRQADGPGGGFLNIHLTPNYNKFITLCWPVADLKMDMWTNPEFCDEVCVPPRIHWPFVTENGAKHNG